MKNKNGRKEKIDTIEKLAILVAEGFGQVDKRFEQVDKRFEQMDRRFENIESELRHIRHELSDLRRRIEHLEELGARHAGFAKEIDYILERIGKIEKHLHLA